MNDEPVSISPPAILRVTVQAPCDGTTDAARLIIMLSQLMSKFSDLSDRDRNAVVAWYTLTYGDGP